MIDAFASSGRSAQSTGARHSDASFEHHIVDDLEVIRRRVEAPMGTVIFVHGAMDRAASFRRVMRRVSTFDTVAYDRRGYAGSLQAATTGRRPADSSGDPLEDHAGDLATIVEWVTSDESRQDGGRTPLRTVVVGHSLGGLIALVATHAPSPQHAPLLAPDELCVFEAPLPWLDLDRATSGSRTIDVARTTGPELAAEFFYRSMVGDATWERIDESHRELRRNEGSALVAELRAARHPRDPFPLPPDAHRLHVGRGDTGPEHLRLAAETLARKARVECEVLEGAPHGAHLSSPGKFAAWVGRSVSASPSQDPST